MKEKAQAGNLGGESENTFSEANCTTPPGKDHSVVRLVQGIVTGDKPPLVDPGLYDLAFLYHETVRLFGGRAQKLALWFRIVSQGKYFETVLPRYYNVKQIKGKPQRHGQFSVGWKSDFLREYATLFKGLPQRKDRIPMSAFEKVIISGKVRRVTKSGTDHRDIPKDLQYSVISELVKVKEL